MRKRLVLVLVGLVAGALVVAGFGTLIVTRRTARTDASRQLLQQATVFAQAANEVRTARVVEVVNRVLKLEGGEIIVVSGGGVVTTPLPAGLSPGALSGSQLAAGQPISGWQGSTAFAAVPTSVSSLLVPVLPTGSHTAVLLTRTVGSLGPSWLYFVLVAGLTLLGAAGIALWLSQRITRPLVDATVVTSRVAGGELSARVTTSSGDIPELVSLAESINTMAARLESTRDHERQMLLSVSHDLRTPLTSIRGYAEAIEEGVAPDTAKAAGVIVSESRRLERLVADLLDLARLELSQLSLRIGPTDVGDVVGRTVEGFLPRASSRGVTLSAAVSEHGPSVVAAADPDRLGQVIANLVENALVFASTAVTVSVLAGPIPAWSNRPGATILVEDDGAGIAPGDLSRVFERFYQADGAAARGSGLGLAIVAELVRAMGGTVQAVSPTGPAGGTRMVVSLPSWDGQAPRPT
jgi:two-component system sensor histidine kinase BaeS